ncbi:MAG: transglycosylase SLT domain-containing protein [Gammaproteobacteria bacterium]
MRRIFHMATLLHLFLLGVILSFPVTANQNIQSLPASKTSSINPFLPLMPRKGDIDSIKQYGYLRVIFEESKIEEFESNSLNKFALENNLKIIYISTKKLSRGQQLLKGGMADVLLGSIDDERGVIKTYLINNEQETTPVTWTTRSKNEGLRDALNHHFNRSLLSQSLQKIYHEDLSDLKKRKRLRVVTRPDPKNYSLRNGRLKGFEYELLQKFAQSQKLWLDLIIAKDETEMYRLLNEGKADIAAIDSPDQKLSSVTRSFPYYPTDNFIVTKKSSLNLRNLHDINGKQIALHEADYQQKGIDHLRDKGLIFSTITLEKSIPMPDFLQQLLDDEFKVAMISAKDYIYAQEFHRHLKVIATDNDKPLHRWVVNQQNTELNTATNSFLRKEFQSKFFNIVYQRNFNKNKITKQEKYPKDFYISPYDHLVKKYSEKYQFDWRLVVAQMYQESKFKPDVTSYAGATGLMQIMPGTAKELGVINRQDPEDSIKAGLKYMKKLRGRYNDKLPQIEKNWFSLASYNAGYERIQDARKFAKKLKLDPDRWFGNVEIAMQKMANPKNRKETRFGFCRCGQTVVYVRTIRELYNNYIQLTDPLIIASANQKLLTDITKPVGIRLDL